MNLQAAIRFVSFSAAFAATALLWAYTACAQDAAQPYKIVVNSAPPYRIIESSAGKTIYAGIYIDIIKEAASRAQMPIKFVEVPFARALKLMEIGRADIMLGPNRTPEREAYMTYLMAELPEETKAFYILPNAPDITTYDDLLDRWVFVLNAAKYFDPFDTDKRIQKYFFNDYRTALKALKGRANAAVIAPELLGDYLLRINRLVRRKASFMAPGKISYITVSRKSALQDKRQTLENALMAMAEDGSFDRIIAQYVDRPAIR